MRRLIRRLYRRYYRSQIRPMPKGSLLKRCALLCGWISQEPGSALR
jgi:hypothetical protein